MPKVNFNDYDENEVGGFGVIPPGRYLVMVYEVLADSTSKGFQMWKLQLKIMDEKSEYYGKMLFDNIVWSDNKHALSRAKLILSRFGVCVSDPNHDYQPEELLYCYAYVTVEKIEKYTPKLGGSEREKSVIGFAGYEAVDITKKEERDDDVPF